MAAFGRTIVGAGTRRGLAALLAAPLALLLAAVVMVTTGTTVRAQPQPRTLEHPSRVRITPAVASDNSLYLFGGLTTQAGVIINADGTLNGGSTPGAGTVTFAMWASNGCSMGQVPEYNGASWVCGAGGGGGGFTGFSDGSAGTPGGYFAADVDTGFWRPGTDILAWSTGGVERGRVDAAGRMGIGATSVQQKLHLYEPSGQVAQRLERGDQETWDITVNSNFEIKHVEGVVTPLTLEATTGFVGVLNNNPAYALDVTGDLQLSGTLRLTSSTVAGSLIPSQADTYNLGSATFPWQLAWVSQLNALIFAEETAQLFGGYQIVGKQVGTFDAAVASGASTINLGETISSLPAWILVRSHTTAGIAAAEYIRVVTLSAGTTYNVERDINNIHATDPAWPDGTAFLVLGSQGDGRLELYSTSGIPRMSIGMNRDSAANPYHVTTNNPADFNEVVRIGGLDGISGAGTGNYGLFVGDASESLIYFGGNLTVTGEVRANAGYIGSGSGVVTIDSSGLDVGASGRIKGGSGVTYAAGTGFFLGFSGANPVFRLGSTSQYMRWTGTALEVAGGSLTSPTITAGAISAGTINGAVITGSTVRTAASGARIVIDTTALRGYDGSGVVQFEALTSDGKLTAGAGNVVLDATGILISRSTAYLDQNTYGFTDTYASGQRPGMYYLEGGASGGSSLRLSNQPGTGATLAEVLVSAKTPDNTDNYLLIQPGRGVEIGATGSVEFFSRPIASGLGGSQRFLINLDNTVTTTPGHPWMRTDGSLLVINAPTELYLNQDTSAPVYVGPGGLHPSVTNSRNLGQPSLRWNEIYWAEPTTTSALFPLVSDNGRIMAKSDGYNGTIVVAGCTISVEFGIVTGKSGGC